jgi:gliding motility-associated-like protein
MKQIYTIAFFIVSSFIFSQVPTLGRIGAWTFSGNANDISGSNNNGVVVGATLTFDRCGNANSAYSFNGTSNYIQMSFAGPTGASARSISFWARTTNTTVASPMAAFAYGSTGGGRTFQVMFNNCAAGVGFNSGTQSLIRGSACNGNNAWHHYVVIFNPALGTSYGNIIFYIDGVLQPGIVCNNGGTSSNINTGPGSAITIGRSSTSASRYWQGDLDDYYFYNRVLTSTEVGQLYTACPPRIIGSPTICAGTSAVYSVAPISNATYVWNLPGGWTGSSTTNTINAIVNSAGSVSVAVSSICGALGTSTIGVATFSLPVVTVATTNTLVCLGNSVTLNASGANSYTWAPVVSTNSAVVTSPTATTIYTVIGGNSSSSCTNLAVFTQSVSAPTMSAASNGSLACVGDMATLTAIGASNYTWMPGNLSGTVVAVSPTITGIYTVTGIAPNGCRTSTNVSVLVPAALTLNVVASTPSACPGTTVILNANVSGGTAPYNNYFWVSGPSNSTYSVSQLAGGNYNYTVSSSDANNCPVVSTIPVFFYNVINFTAPNVSVCPGSTATLTVAGAQTYTWFPGASGGTSLTLTPLGPTPFTVEATSVNGCTAATIVSAFLKPVPLLSVLTKSIDCLAAGSATVSAIGTNGPYSYTWSPTAQTNSVAVNLNAGNYTVSILDLSTGCTSVDTTSFSPLVPLAGTVVASNSVVCFGLNTGTASIVLTGTSSLESYTWAGSASTQSISNVSGLIAGVYTVTVLNPVTFCSIVDTFTITQPSPVVLNIFPSATLACVNTPIILSAINSGGTGPHSYSWSSGPSTSVYSTTQLAGGPYTYSVNSVDANLCAGDTSIVIQFVDYPNLQSGPFAICRGSAATLTVSGAQTYVWYPGAFAGSSVNYFPTATTVYTVFGSTFGCTSVGTASVFVNALPVPVISSSSNSFTICEGSPLNLSTSGNGTFQWFGPNSYSTTGISLGIPSVSLSSSGHYTLFVTDNNGCSASTSTMITVLENPLVTAPGTSVCAGESATLTASGGVSYGWYGPTGFAASTSSFVVPTVTTSLVYSVFVTGVNNCSVSVQVPIVALPYPLPSPTIVANPKVCQNTSLNLKGSGGSTYLWAGPGNLTSTNPTLGFIAESLNMSGIYTLTVRNTSNCVASTTVMVTVRPAPKASLSVDQNNLCVPFCSKFSLNASPENIAPIIGFYFAGNSSNISNTFLSSCFQTPQNKVVTVNYLDTNSCISSASLLIGANPRPVADFIFDPPRPRSTLDRVFFINRSVSTAQSQWTWIFENDKNINQESNPSHIFERNDLFPVVLIVKNSWGCSDTVIKVVTVTDDISLYVPNAFTPNNDGKNDVFQPSGLGFSKFSLNIFDAWGLNVFSSNDINQAWDGTNKGAPCAFESYIWVIELVGSKGQELRYEGQVSLLR